MRKAFCSTRLLFTKNLFPRNLVWRKTLCSTSLVFTKSSCDLQTWIWKNLMLHNPIEKNLKLENHVFEKWLIRFTKLALRKNLIRFATLGFAKSLMIYNLRFLKTLSSIIRILRRILCSTSLVLGIKLCYTTLFWRKKLYYTTLVLGKKQYALEIWFWENPYSLQRWFWKIITSLVLRKKLCFKIMVSRKS